MIQDCVFYIFGMLGAAAEYASMLDLKFFH